MNEAPNVEVLLPGAEIRVGDELFGMVVVTAGETTDCEKVDVRLLATSRRGILAPQHEIHRETLRTGRLASGRHELPFSITVPQATYSGRLFEIDLSIDAMLMFDHGEPLVTEPKVINAITDGALQLASTASEISPSDNNDESERYTPIVAAVVVGFLGFLVSLLSTPTWIATLLWFAITGAVYTLATSAVEQAGQPDVREIDIEVEPITGGFSTTIEVFSRVAIVVETLKVVVFANEVIQRPGGRQMAKSRARETIETLAEAVPISAGRSFAISHEHHWQADDPASIEIDEYHLQWFLEVLLDIENGAQFVRTIPLDVAYRPPEVESVVASEVFDDT